MNIRRDPFQNPQQQPVPGRKNDRLRLPEEGIKKNEAKERLMRYFSAGAEARQKTLDAVYEHINNQKVDLATKKIEDLQLQPDDAMEIDNRKKDGDDINYFPNLNAPDITITKPTEPKTKPPVPEFEDD